MGSSTSPRDPQVINLNRMLAAQERQLLSDTPDEIRNKWDLARIRANCDYARSLLLTLSSTKQLSQDDIHRKRAIVKRIQARLIELDDVVAKDDDTYVSEDESQIQPQQVQEVGGIRQRSAASQGLPPKDTEAKSTSIANRYTQPAADKFQNEKTALQTREGALAEHEKEKESIQKEMLNLAIQLKQSVRGFGASIEAEKDTLDATASGMDTSSGTMEGAGGKMKALQRETEGAGFFRRIRLYAEVAAIWVFILILVLVLPKLRF